MFAWLKKLFIPHRRNNHISHLLRTEMTTFALGLVLGVEVLMLLFTFVIAPRTGILSAILPGMLSAAANNDRATQGEGQLAFNPLLQQAAQLKAQDMAAKGYFAHTSPSGVTPWSWLEKVGYRYTAAGENLAVNFLDSADVHIAWMKSPAHRANILNPTYTEIGIATANGIYKGNEVVFVAQFFGHPAVAKKPVVAPAQKTSPIPTQSIVPVAQSTVAGETTLAQEILAAPRANANRIFVIVMIIIGLAVVLTLIVRSEVRYATPVLNGILVLVVSLAMILVNQYLGVTHSVVIALY